MDKFFNPRSIAVVGASQKANLGNHVVQNLKAGFSGTIYPINPNYQEIEGLPAYPSITATPGPVDLAIVLVPAVAIAAVLEDCAAKGTQRVIIESAGFSETGDQGHLLQQACDRIAQKANIRLWGPNCMGLVDLHKKHFFTFMHPKIRGSKMLPGRISLIVQSGMMSAIFLSELAQRGIGVAKACSIGNRADIDECDILPYLEKDPDTDVIAMYLESIPRGRLFAQLVRKCSKPIVLLKGGQSQAGATAAQSHTSSLSGDSRLLNSILSQSGVVMANSVFQMMDMANTLAMIPNMNPAARVAIMTLSGGAGILACDALERTGLTIATLSNETKEKLKEVFPPWMPPSNPIDLFPAVAHSGRAKAFTSALTAAIADPGVDAVVIHFVAGLQESVPDLSELKSTANRLGKTVAVWLMGLSDAKQIFKEKAGQAGIVIHSDGARLAECLKAVAHFNAHRDIKDKPPVPEVTLRTLHKPTSNQTWDEHDSKNLLHQWDIPTVEEMIAGDSEQAQQFAQRVGFPVVIKGLAPGKAHKTEFGLVKTGITDVTALKEAFEETNARLNGEGRLLIQKQEKSHYELIVGFLRDNQFGPCVMFGIGGILAELEPDVAFALAPLDSTEAEKLIHSLRSRKLMQGFRSMPPLDTQAMTKLLINLGNLGAAHPEITQIDINPLMVYNGHPIAVDANIIVRK